MDPGIAMFIPPPSPGLVAPVSVQAAMRGREWDIPHGWRTAAIKEVTRVEGFRGWRMVSGREMRELRRAHPSQVSLGNIVAVLTVKRDPSGNQREIDVVRKLRVAISDPTSKDSVDVASYSSRVDPYVQHHHHRCRTFVARGADVHRRRWGVLARYSSFPGRGGPGHFRSGPGVDAGSGLWRVPGF